MHTSLQQPELWPLHHILSILIYCGYQPSHILAQTLIFLVKQDKSCNPGSRMKLDTFLSSVVVHGGKSCVLICFSFGTKVVVGLDWRVQETKSTGPVLLRIIRLL